MSARGPAAPLARGTVIATLSVLGLWSVLVAALWWDQERLLFEPTPLGASAAIAGPDVTEDWFDVPGARLHAIHFRQPLVDGVRRTKGLIFFLHGNVGNVATWFIQPGFWRDSGFDLYMLDYRGFGKSTGRIQSEAQLHADVLAAWQRIAPEYVGLKTVIIGRSLGTGLAVQLAATVQPDLLVLVSPYSSMTAVMNYHYPWVPNAILRFPLVSERFMGLVQGPTLIFHGLKDSVIPWQQSLTLSRDARHSQLVLLPNVGHADVHEDRTYLNTLQDRLHML
ncbi:MAG TPA: alpha/beta fold hydrolase [Steroidobacteraceae bacterium]|nr:alpha/beta fold hydrolase [Steroidobacteraceae bacterium]